VESKINCGFDENRSFKTENMKYTGATYIDFWPFCWGQRNIIKLTAKTFKFREKPQRLKYYLQRGIPNLKKNYFGLNRDEICQTPTKKQICILDLFGKTISGNLSGFDVATFSWNTGRIYSKSKYKTLQPLAFYNRASFGPKIKILDYFTPKILILRDIHNV